MIDRLFIKTLRTSLNSLLCIGAVLLPFSGQAEEETEAQRKQRLKDYYVVDLIIFKHNEKSAESSEYPEQWTKDINFFWPENSLTLSNSQLAAVYPELGIDISKLQADVKQNLEKHANEGTNQKNNLALTTQTFSALNKEAQKIDRVQRYGLLSHRSWVQKIQVNKPAKDIVIPISLSLSKTQDNANNVMFDINPEETYVTGTIGLRKNRYLHVSTNLMAISLLSTPYVAIKTTEEVIDVLSMPVTMLEEGIEEPAELKIFTPWPSIPLKSKALEKKYFEKTTDVAAEQTPYPLTLPSEYIAQIAQFKQTRRMRSRETHYIDHPIIGLVIRITPLIVMLDENKAN